MSKETSSILRCLGGCLLVVFSMQAAPVTANDGLKEIIDRGVLRAGVQVDKRPFGFRDPSGQIVGIDPDVLGVIAERIGVKIEFVAVIATNRMQFLQQGKIDIFSANMNDTVERRKIVGAVLPNSWPVGVGALTRKQDGFKAWKDLRGHTGCTIEGAWYNRLLDQDYGIKTVTFKGVSEAQTALDQGRCRAFVGNDMEIFFRLEESPGRYPDYEMVLPVVLVTPYAVAVALDQKDKALGTLVSGIMYEGHASGKFRLLWKKWGLPTSAWLDETYEKLKDPLKAE